MDEDDGWWMRGMCWIPGCNRGAAAFPTVARIVQGPPRTPQAAAAAAAAAAGAAGAVLLFDKHLTKLSAVKTSAHSASSIAP